MVDKTYTNVRPSEAGQTIRMFRKEANPMDKQKMPPDPEGQTVCKL